MGKAQTTEKPDPTTKALEQQDQVPDAAPGDDLNRVLRQNAPIHCPYCKHPCEAKSDSFFTRYRCVNKECGGRYSIKVARPRLRDRLGPKSGEGDHSAR